MPLPEVKHVKYEFFCDELKKKIKYRPFLIGEQKALLSAIEFGDAAALSNTILDIVTACTFGELDMRAIPTHIVDLIYLKIFIKSSGSKVQAQYNCSGTILKLYEGEQRLEDCGAHFPMLLDLDRGEIKYPEGFEEKKLVVIDDESGIRLKVPNYEDIRNITLKGGLLDLTDSFIFACIESIYSSESISVPGIDFNEEELVAWMNKLTGPVLEKISAFFEQLPYLGMDVPVTCPDCGKKEVINLRGLDDFFV